MAIQKLNKETKQKILKELKLEHHKRYGAKYDGEKYVSSRKTYNVDELMSDLEFVLNHLHHE